MVRDGRAQFWLFLLYFYCVAYFATTRVCPHINGNVLVFFQIIERSANIPYPELWEKEKATSISICEHKDRNGKRVERRRNCCCLSDVPGRQQGSSKEERETERPNHVAGPWTLRVIDSKLSYRKRYSALLKKTPISCNSAFQKSAMQVHKRWKNYSVNYSARFDWVPH